MIPNFIAHKVYLSGLPRESSHPELLHLLSHFGPLKRLKLIKNKGVHSGAIAFATFRDSTSAQTLLAQGTLLYRSTPLDCRSVTHYKQLELANSKLLQRRVYIGGFCKSLREPDIAALFARFGRVESVTVNRLLETGASRGSGFVLFCEAKSAERAVREDGQEIEGLRFVVRSCLARDRTHTQGQTRPGSQQQQQQVTKDQKSASGAAKSQQQERTQKKKQHSQSRTDSVERERTGTAGWVRELEHTSSNIRFNLGRQSQQRVPGKTNDLASGYLETPVLLF